MKKLYTLLSLIMITASSQAQVVISQVYGGGGNGGAVYTNDFVELFNKGNAPVDITGWSIQLASATGSGWLKSDLPSATIGAGKYFLIQHAAGANTALLALPTPDFVPTGGGVLAIAGTNVKILLANTTTLVSLVTAPTDSQIVDVFGAGTSNFFEGTVAAPLGNALSGQRKLGGCQDTNNNLADFESLTPAPRNSATAANDCALSTKQNSISGLKVYANNNNLFVTSDSNESKSVLVYNILGKNVVKTTVTNQGINVADLSSGIYIVKVTENGKSSTVKVVLK